MSTDRHAGMVVAHDHTSVGQLPRDRFFEKNSSSARCRQVRTLWGFASLYRNGVHSYGRRDRTLGGSPAHIVMAYMAMPDVLRAGSVTLGFAGLPHDLVGGRGIGTRP